MDTEPAGIFMSRQVALSVRFLWVSITPLLLPVVPDVKRMAQSLSLSGFSSKLPPCSVSSLGSSLCMEMMYLMPSQAVLAMSATSARSSS